jgi:hypothetical protein
VSPKQVITDREDLLAAAGFTSRAANTPERQRQLATLPAHRFVERHRDGQTVIVYADPTVCDCVYFGGPDVYARYQQEIQARGMQGELQAPERMNEGPQWSWGDW